MNKFIDSILEPYVIAPVSGILVLFGNKLVNRVFHKKEQNIKVEKDEAELSSILNESVKNVLLSHKTLISELSVSVKETRLELEQSEKNRRQEMIEFTELQTEYLKQITSLTKRIGELEDEIAKLKKVNAELDEKYMKAQTKLAQAYIKTCLVPDCKKRKKEE